MRTPFLFAFVLAIASACNLLVPADQRCMNRIIQKTMKELKSEGFEYVSVGVRSGPGPEYWLEHLMLGVRVDELLLEDKARELVIHSARKLKYQIDSAECADLLFKDLPVSAEQVAISVYGKVQEEGPYAPFIRSTALRKGKVIYQGQLGPESQGYDYIYEETLEEALEKLGEKEF